MRTLGLIGGLTFRATALYYTQINEHIQKKLGGGHSAKIVLHSFDWADIMRHFHAGDYNEISRQMASAGKGLQSIGADALVLCANTAHQWAEDIEKVAGIPLLHIIDFTGEDIRIKGFKTVALLGTKLTMEGAFVKGRLEDKYGLKVLLPEEALWTPMSNVISGDLAEGVVSEQTKRMYLDAVEDLVRRGAQGIILGCTELQFVLQPGEVEVPLFETVELHARGVAEWALEDESI